MVDHGVGFAESGGEHLGDVGEEVEAEVFVGEHGLAEGLEIEGSDGDVSGGDDVSGAGAGVHEGDFADDVTGGDFGEGVVVVGGDSDFAAEDDVHFFGGFSVSGEELPVGEEFDFGEFGEGFEFCVGESVGEVGVFEDVGFDHFCRGGYCGGGVWVAGGGLKCAPRRSVGGSRREGVASGRGALLIMNLL